MCDERYPKSDSGESGDFGDFGKSESEMKARIGNILGALKLNSSDSGDFGKS